MVGSVDEGKYFSYQDISFSRDFLIQVEAREDFDQVGVWLDGDAMFFGKRDDFVGHCSGAFADQAWGSISFLIVFYRNGFFLRLCLAGRFFLRHTENQGQWGFGEDFAPALRMERVI